MVKFRPLNLKFSYNKSKKHSAKVSFNSVYMPLLTTLGSITNNRLIVRAKKQKIVSDINLPAKILRGNKLNFQAFYELQTFLFGFKYELENRKIFQVLYSFVDKNLLVANTKSSRNLVNKSNHLNLLGFANLSLRRSFYLNQLKYSKSLVAPRSKILVGLAKTLSVVPPRNLVPEISSVWNLQRLFRKIQVVNFLSGSNGFFSHTLLENWNLNKISNKNSIPLNDLQLLYHIRRVKDKIEFIPVSSDKEILVNYLQSALKILSLKSNNQRLIFLKGILRKTKHRRRSRWNIFSRKYVKMKRYSVIFTSRETLSSALKANKIYFSNVEN